MDPAAFSNAMFLVQVFPLAAAMLLCEKNLNEDITTVVKNRAEIHFTMFVGQSRTQIQALVERHEWETLKALSPSNQVPTTPRAYNTIHGGSNLPLSPSLSSSASGPARSHRQQSIDRIMVLHSGGESPLLASSSGCAEYLIGIDKLQRFSGVTRESISSPYTIEFGGKGIEVNERIRLTWKRQDDTITDSSYFYIVRPEHIQFADVLLGNSMQRSRGARMEGPSDSPYHIALDRMDSWTQQPPVPTPPAAAQAEYGHPFSTNSIHTRQDHPHDTSGHPPQSDSGQTAYQRPLSSVRTATSVAESRPYHDASSTVPPPSTSSSNPATSTQIGSLSRENTVVIQLSFGGQGKKIVPLDLTKSGDQIFPWLEPHVLRLTGNVHLDKAIHELKVVPLQGSNREAETTALSDLDYCWDTIQYFIQQNRANKKHRRAEFCFDIV
ncbi:hypothetical protein WAI453_005616 [Rhynchosporium graminicola]